MEFPPWAAAGNDPKTNREEPIPGELLL